MNDMERKSQIEKFVDNYYYAYDFLRNENIADLKRKALTSFLNTDLSLEEINDEMAKIVEDRYSKYLEKYNSLFALVNNAGIYHPAKDSKASNGYPLTIMTNYLGGYYLSKLFLPLLEKNDDSRLVFECSIAANFNKFKSLDFLSKSMKNTNIEYNLSKLAIGKEFCYLANQGYNTKVLMAHPGIASTNIFSSKGNSFARWFKWLATKLLPIFVHSTAKASLGLLKCVANKTIKNGTYLGPRGLFHIGGYPKTIKPSRYFQKNNAQLILETEDIISKLK